MAARCAARSRAVSGAGCGGCAPGTGPTAVSISAPRPSRQTAGCTARMRKRPFVIAAVLAVCLAVLIPLWAYLSDADEDSGERAAPASLKSGQQLFETNCGTCHTLYAAGTDGNFGPNLDSLLAPTGPATDKS